MVERRRTWNWRDRAKVRDEAEVDDEMLVAETEMITGLGLEESYALGEQAGAVWSKHFGADGAEQPDLAVEPGAIHIEHQGRQSTLLTIERWAPEVDEAMAAEAAARDAEARSELALRDLVEAEHRAQQKVDEHERRAEQVSWSLLEDSPGWLFGILIGAIAVGEWVLNRVPFEVAGDDQLGTDLLAATVGIGLVVAAHLAGVGIKRALVRASDERGPATHHLVMAAVLIALILAVVAISGLRAAYFAQAARDVPWMWLMVLQAFLLTVATLLSMAHDAPMRAELSRLQDILEDVQEQVIAASVAHRRARHTRVDAQADARATRTKALTQVQVQDAHTSRSMAEFVAGLQAATGRIVPYVRPQAPELLRIEAWRDGLYGEPDDQETDVGDQIRAWRTALDAVGPTDVAGAPDVAGTADVADTPDVEDVEFVDLRAAEEARAPRAQDAASSFSSNGSEPHDAARGVGEPS